MWGWFTTSLLGVLCLTLAPAAAAQGGAIWRCGNEYTNQPGPNPAARGCREVQGGHVTIVEGTRPGANQSGTTPANGSVPARAAAFGARAPGERVEPEQQRQRDAEARRILEEELRRAEERLQRARADYADGRPPPLATENADTAAYQARVQELRARVERAEADVAAIRREMGRLGGADGR